MMSKIVDGTLGYIIRLPTKSCSVFDPLDYKPIGTLNLSLLGPCMGFFYFIFVRLVEELFLVRKAGCSPVRVHQDNRIT